MLFKSEIFSCHTTSVNRRHYKDSIVVIIAICCNCCCRITMNGILEASQKVCGVVEHIEFLGITGNILESLRLY